MTKTFTIQLDPTVSMKLEIEVRAKTREDARRMAKAWFMKRLMEAFQFDPKNSSIETPIHWPLKIVEDNEVSGD